MSFENLYNHDPETEPEPKKWENMVGFFIVAALLAGVIYAFIQDVQKL